MTITIEDHHVHAFVIGFVIMFFVSGLFKFNRYRRNKRFMKELFDK